MHIHPSASCPEPAQIFQITKDETAPHADRFVPRGSKLLQRPFFKQHGHLSRSPNVQRPFWVPGYKPPDQRALNVDTLLATSL
eukprot:1017942-Lingulodinium_polyedra.AAC.1